MTDRDLYTERVLRLVEAVPPGRVTTYGDLAEMVGRGGPRQVGTVLARHGGGVPWWRVVRADGRPADGLADRALRRLGAEGVRLRGDRVDLAAARWRPGPADLAGADALGRDPRQSGFQRQVPPEVPNLGDHVQG